MEKKENPFDRWGRRLRKPLLASIIVTAPASLAAQIYFISVLADALPLGRLAALIGVQLLLLVGVAATSDEWQERRERKAR